MVQIYKMLTFSPAVPHNLTDLPATILKTMRAARVRMSQEMKKEVKEKRRLSK